MKLKKIISALILTALLLFSSGIATAAALTDNPAELEAFIDGFINAQMIEHDIIGVTLAVVDSGEIALLKGYGYADYDLRKPVDPHTTLFRPGSTAKLVTWTAVMQLVEADRLELDTDVNEYLDFEIPGHIHGAERSSRPGPVTLRHLLTHTPGFEDRGEGLFVLSSEEMETLEEYVKGKIPARVFPPGEVMAYSNYGTALAGYIVELVSGQPFAEYVEANIFKPLDMHNSTFVQPLPENLAPHLAESYKFHNGEYYQGSFEYISALPAGSMSSTAEDMAAFMIAHLQEGRYKDARILEEATAHEMHRRQFSHHPLLDGMTYGFIEQTINGRRIINHGGNTFLFATGCYLLLEEGVGLFVSYSGGTGIEREDLIFAFMDRYYPAHRPPDELVPTAESALRSNALAGEYLPNRGNFTTVEKIFSLLQATRVSVNEDGYLLVPLMGELQQFVEVETGLYFSRYPERAELFTTMAFIANHEGTMMLCAEGPLMTLTRLPWYGGSAAIGLLTLSSLLLMLTATIGWSAASLGRLFRRETSGATRASLFARLTTIFCGLLLLFFFFGLIGVITDINPAFGVPRLILEESETLNSLLVIPYLIAIATVAMIIFSIIAWLKRYWTVGGRIHYSIITLSCLGLIWVMVYTNLL